MKGEIKDYGGKQKAQKLRRNKKGNAGKKVQLLPKEKVKCVREHIKCEGRKIKDYWWKMKGTSAKEKNAKDEVENKRCR